MEYASNTEVQIVVEHNYNGEDLTLTDFEYELLDANGEVLIAREAFGEFDPDTTSSTITIAASNNTTTAKTDARLLVCYLIKGSSTYTVPIVYTLKGNVLELTPLEDSFMTFTESILVRLKIAEQQIYYDALTDEMKAVALENSFERLAELRFKVGETRIDDITALELSAFNALDPKFLLALKKAQIIEANLVVENSPISDKIRAGIISETIGESSMFFRQSGPLPGRYKGISDDAYEVLGKWLYKDTTSANIWKLNRG